MNGVEHPGVKSGMDFKELPTLTFQHVFSDGIPATLIVKRKEFTPPVMECDRKQFQKGKLDREYREWRNQIVETLVSNALLTDGELCALALKTAGL